jgi:alkanesulfonate monooxygenase SsuD/methylene tetrahydromethanopterin reductase-like flavin-dependent oxidoreductase (luciferase family)
MKFGLTLPNRGVLFDVTTPDEMLQMAEIAEEMGRDPASIETHLYHNINLNADRSAALEESKRFLDIYYSQDTPADRVKTWTAAGTPDECVQHLRTYQEMGIDEVTIRITGWDQLGQLDRVINEVVPRMETSA